MTTNVNERTKGGGPHNRQDQHQPDDVGQHSVPTGPTKRSPDSRRPTRIAAVRRRTRKYPSDGKSRSRGGGPEGGNDYADQEVITQ